VAQSGQVDPELYDLYLKGRHAWNQRTSEGFAEAIRFYEQALAKDASFARGYAGLADVYALLGTAVYGSTGPREAMTRAKAAAEKAVALDDGLAEAHRSLARVRQNLDWDWADADREFRRALALNPGDATTHQWFAIFLAEQERHAEAAEALDRALRLNPLSANAHRAAGLVHYYARRFDAAAAAEERSILLDPAASASHMLQAWIHLARGDAASAARVSRALAVHAESTALRRATLAVALQRFGDRPGAKAIADALLNEASVPTSVAIRLRLGLGQTSEALALLGRAVDERSDMVPTLRADPLFDPVRSDPRFAAILKRVRLG
jgi:Tfp pilus assembly protein PilF